MRAPAMDEDEDIYLDSGAKVPQLKVDASLFLNKTVVVYGPSGTGKTVIVKNIMHLLRILVEICIVVSPTEPANRSYHGYVDPPLIHHRLYLADPKNPNKDDGKKGAVRFLDTIEKRQSMLAAMCGCSNDPILLQGLFMRVAGLSKEDYAEAQKAITRYNGRRMEINRALERQYSGEALDEKVGSVNARFREMLGLLYKKYVERHREALWEQEGLTPKERLCLCYIRVNPNFLLVLDDCAADLKSCFNLEVFRRLFYQNRHNLTTFVLCCQDDTDLPTNLRKNAYVSFFTEEVVCLSNFERASNKYPKQVKLLAAEAAKAVFAKRYRMLAYIREDPAGHHFYHVTFPKPALFRFGSRAAHSFCDLVRGDEMPIDANNPFYGRFRVG